MTEPTPIDRALESIQPARPLELAELLRKADHVRGGLRSSVVRVSLLTCLLGAPRTRLELAFPDPKKWKAPR